jgi:hypothetical protein
MKNFMSFGAAAAATLVTLITLSTYAGPGVTGGGNVEEIHFVGIANSLAADLTSQPEVAFKTLGINSTYFKKAVESTLVQCAYGSYLNQMRELQKKFYFDDSANSIFIDCLFYDSKSQPDMLVKQVVFHEYLRKLGVEASDSKISSKLPVFYQNVEAKIQSERQSRNTTAVAIPIHYRSKVDLGYGRFQYNGLSLTQNGDKRPVATKSNDDALCGALSWQEGNSAIRQEEYESLYFPFNARWVMTLVDSYHDGMNVIMYVPINPPPPDYNYKSVKSVTCRGS